MEEAERKVREEEDARLAMEKAQRDDIESKQREKELGELKLKKEMDMKQRLEEEKLRMKHEQEVKAIEAQKKGFPKWVIGVVAGVFLIAAVVVGIILVQMKNRADAQEKARIAAEQDSIEKEKKRGKEMAQLQTLLSKMEDKANLTEQELAEQRALQEQLKKLQEDQATSSTTKKKKRKKKKKSGSSKGPSLDLGDPLSGIGM